MIEHGAIVAHPRVRYNRCDTVKIYACFQGNFNNTSNNFDDSLIMIEIIAVLLKNYFFGSFFKEGERLPIILSQGARG